MSHETIKTLVAEIRAELLTIERIFEQLAQMQQSIRQDQPVSFQERVTVGYLLHNLYSAFENIFKNIARAFENAIEEREAWHAQLLRRMTLEIESVRPKVIGPQSYDALDELRRFRHLFRYSYSLELDWDRMGLVLRKVDSSLRGECQKDLNEFLRFLEDLK